LDCGLFRETELEVVARVIDYAIEWQAPLIGVEDVNFSSLYFSLFDLILQRDYRGFRPDFISCYTEGRQKPVRIKNNLRAPMQDGFWYFNSGYTGRLTQEILEYPNSETLDLIDALAYTDEVIHRPETPNEQIFSAYGRRLSEEGRGITGYGNFMESA
jgi:hypothetical protein